MVHDRASHTLRNCRLSVGDSRTWNSSRASPERFLTLAEALDARFAGME